MFNKVRILDSKGNTKRVLSSKFLSKRYWNTFFQNSNKIETSKKAKVQEEAELDKSNAVNYENLHFSEDR